MKSSSLGENIPKDQIESVECKFVTHVPGVTQDEIDEYEEKMKKRKGRYDPNMPNRPRPDLHFVKEWIETKDGKRIPNLRVIENFKKPFWITKPHLQKYKQKKEAQDLNNLNKYFGTETTLGADIASKLGQRYVGKKSVRDVRDSPYVYGLDVSSQAYIKKMYHDKYNKNTASALCVLDIEEDMKKKEVIVMTITMKDKSYTTILNDFVNNDSGDTIDSLNYLYDKHVPKTPLTQGIKREYEFFNTEMGMVRALFAKLHEWQPDFVEVWNIGYDIPRIVQICKEYGVNPKEVFSHPDIPKEQQYFKYNQGQTSRLTEAGVFKPKDLHEQWHTVACPASFFFVDGMSAYFYIRQGSKKIPTGYSLDSILNVELGSKFQKLKFKDGKVEKLVKLAWHNYMVKTHPLLYIIYNNYDTTGPLLLDDKTTDIQNTLPMLNGFSHFNIFDSGPKKIVEALHFFCLDRGMVLGSKPVRADDDKKLGLSDWIVTLPSFRIKPNGLNLIKEGGHLRTNLRGHTLDADQVSGYPSDGQAANVSKDTTTKEVLAIEGLTKNTFMRQNINLFFGPVNSVEYCTEMHNFPSLYELYKDIKYMSNNKDYEREEKEKTA